MHYYYYCLWCAQLYTVPRHPIIQHKVIEQKGMTFDHDFFLYYSPFLFPPKKEVKRKGE